MSTKSFLNKVQTSPKLQNLRDGKVQLYYTNKVNGCTFTRVYRAKNDTYTLAVGSRNHRLPIVTDGLSLHELLAGMQAINPDLRQWIAI